MEHYEIIAKAKSVEGKVPLSEVYKVLKNNYKIARRTAQTYMKNKLLPRPRYDWKDGFYTTESATELFARAYLIMKLKEYRNIPVGMISRIFIRHKVNINSLLKKLITIVREYRWYDQNSDPYEPVLDEENAETVRRICEKIQKGVSLKQISSPGILLKEIEKEG
ncbi:MAG: hypothetical protein AB1629_00865 [Candidatus Omnitrophota bacterium]